MLIKNIILKTKLEKNSESEGIELSTFVQFDLRLSCNWSTRPEGSSDVIERFSETMPEWFEDQTIIKTSEFLTFWLKSKREILSFVTRWEERRSRQRTFDLSFPTINNWIEKESRNWESERNQTNIFWPKTFHNQEIPCKNIFLFLVLACY